MPTSIATIWEAMLQSVPRDRWIELDRIYSAVEATIDLQPDDIAPSAPDNAEPTWRRNVRNVLQTRKHSDIIWGHRGRYLIPENLGDTEALIVAEKKLRADWWQEISDLGGPNGLPPDQIRQMGIYRGAQGIWVDKDRTGHLTPDGNGIAVGLLHTGTAYPDELDEDALIYHYPDTDRPPAPDQNEIQALKNARLNQVPVFAIIRPTPSSTLRDLKLGWVEDWNDNTREFLINLRQDEPPTTTPTTIDEEPFRLTNQRPNTTTEQIARPGQAKFRFDVFQRYGAECAVCGIDYPQLLDAVHIRPFSENGTDDPRNGLVMCANHHRAFDNGLFTISPTTLAVVPTPQGPSLRSLGITTDSIAHQTLDPHIDALRFHWESWQSS